jgi:hypothetical protein
MMFRSRIVLLPALLAGMCLTVECPMAGARQDKTPKTEDMNMVSLEVAAFRTLRTLRATPAQMKGLQALLKEEFVKDSKREAAKTTFKFRKSLLAVRDMFRTSGPEADDDEDVKLALDRLDLLRDEDEELDDGVDLTPAAGLPAREALRLFTPRQIFALMKSTEEEISDPIAVLIGALEDSLTVSADDWKILRDEAASQVAWMTSGLGSKGPTKVRGEAVKWLDSKYALKLKGPEFNKQRRKLEAEAAEKFKVFPTTVLGNIAWHRLAELLCNPRLPAALKARLKAK